MSGNAELLRKADIAVADLQADGGYLNPEQADTFIRKLLVQPTILKQARTVVMNSPQRKVNKIQFASRILRKAVASTALAAADRAKPTTEQIQLNTDEVIAEVHLPYDVIEDNIERGNIGLAQDVGGQPVSGGIKDTIMQLIAERAALDLEEFALLADTASADDYLAMQDGWLKLCNANVLDAGGAPISRQVLTNLMKTLPDQYRRNRPAMRHFVSQDNEIDYRETVAQRETALGDSQLAGLAPVYAAGTPVEGASLMPADKGLLTHPLNLLWGIQRQIQVETDKDIRTREYIIVLTARIALQIEEADASVKLTNLGAA